MLKVRLVFQKNNKPRIIQISLKIDLKNEFYLQKKHFLPLECRKWYIFFEAPTNICCKMAPLYFSIILDHILGTIDQMLVSQ